MPVDDIYTKLLLHFDGADNSTTFTDEAGKTVTPSGDAKISTTQSKFGGASGYFDGNGDYLSTANAADWDWSTGNFTVDFWLYTADTGRAEIILDKSYYTVGQNGGWRIYYDASGTNASINFISSDGQGTHEPVNTGNDITFNQWNHFAIVREGTGANQTKIYINGVMKGQGIQAKALGQGSSDIRIGYGQGYMAGYDYLTGYVDELRVSKGIARWTGNFTPPIWVYGYLTRNNIMLF
jgi:putative component of toxin-antitoxin plasmid stabilization module